MAIDINIPSQVKNYANLAAFPATGSVKTIFIAEDTNKTYRWTGSAYVEISATAASTWGAIGGTLSSQTDLQTALNAKVTGNTAITGATKTKVTYDSKGLVTAGADATTADIADSLNKRYVTDANLTTIANTSGVNTGDQTLAGLGGVPTTRTLTINGTTQDLSANRTFTVATGITIGTTAITSGVVGSVLFEGTGNVVQESANLFWDNTNGRLGIGTSSPLNPLQISYNSALSQGIHLNTNNTATSFNGLKFSANNTNPSIFGLNNQTGEFRWEVGSGGYFPTIYSNGAERLRIYITGNVLINTTTDAGFKLDVNGTARVVNQATIQTLTIGLGGGAIATNTALGLNALTSNSTGANNTSVGSSSLRANTIGDYNTSVGLDALRFNTGGGQNTAVGWRALNSVLTGYGNVAVGAQALISTTGGFNIGVGERAGESNTTGTYNICIGAQTQTGNFSNSVILGRSATATASNQFVVGTATYNVGAVVTETNISSKYWEVVINGVTQKVLLA